MTRIDTGLERELLDWVADWSEQEPGGALGPDTDLLGSGLLDSMGLVALIAFLEDRTGAGFDYGQFDPGAAASVRSLVEYCRTAQDPA